MAIKVINGVGFSAEEAFADKLDFVAATNATQSWKNAGSPTGEAFNDFAAEYLAKKTKNVAGLGAYVVVTSAVKDTRERPYSVENVISVPKKWKTYYLPFFADGTPVAFDGDKPETKEEGVALAKALVTDNQKKVIVKIKKEVVEGEEVAAVVDYVPSKNTQIGTYMFFGIEK